jgi:hypothetical protein
MEITILGKDLDVAYLLQLGEKTSKLIGKTVKIALDKPKEGGCIVIFEKKTE